MPAKSSALVSGWFFIAAAICAKLVLFQKELGARRVINFDDHISPHMEVYDPDFTVSAIVLEGAKFPTAANPSFK